VPDVLHVPHRHQFCRRIGLRRIACNHVGVDDLKPSVVICAGKTGGNSRVARHISHCDRLLCQHLDRQSKALPVIQCALLRRPEVCALIRGARDRAESPMGRVDLVVVLGLATLRHHRSELHRPGHRNRSPSRWSAWPMIAPDASVRCTKSVGAVIVPSASRLRRDRSLVDQAVTNQVGGRVGQCVTMNCHQARFVKFQVGACFVDKRNQWLACLHIGR
jgi:hypothetical protein